MKKIVINRCYGGFGLSPRASYEYLKLIGKPCFFFVKERIKDGKFEGPSKYKYISKTLEEAEEYNGFCLSIYLVGNPLEALKRDNSNYQEISFYSSEIPRDDGNLVKVVELLGEKANSKFSKLRIIEISDDVEWEIDDYDGIEHVAEKHRVWS